MFELKMVSNFKHIFPRPTEKTEEKRKKQTKNEKKIMKITNLKLLGKR